MIRPTSTDTKLNILLTHTNKALAEALKHASPEQLERLNEGKDIRTVLGDLFNDKLSSSKSDQILLDILKSSPVFKHMGSFPDTLQLLTEQLKSASVGSEKISALEPFILHVRQQNGSTLKANVSNSGVFMESKIASALQLLPSLNATLESLKSLVSQSSLPGANSLETAIEALQKTYTNTDVQHHPDTAKTFAAKLQKIVSSFQNLTADPDILYSAKTKGIVQALETFASTPNLSGQSLGELKSTLSELFGSLLRSKAVQANTLLDTIESLLQNLSAQKSGAESASSVESFIRQMHDALDSRDPLYSGEASDIVARLKEINGPKELLLDTILKESMQNDLKSVLTGLAEEIRNSPVADKEALLEPINKLLTQIDYHQLLSHLSASSSIYFPFAWDQLEEGSVAFKRGKEKKFYCEINLKLKEYGPLDLMMALYDENQLEIQAHTQSPELKQRLEETITQLRSVLIDAGVTPRRIRIFLRDGPTNPKEAPYSDSSDVSHIGFEAKA